MRHPRGPIFFLISAKFIFKIIASAVNENIKKVAEEGERKCVREKAKEKERQTLPGAQCCSLFSWGRSSFALQISTLQTPNIVVLLLSNHNEMIIVLTSLL